jgi:putative nucleotidyltransferase with HDIG domain
MDRNQALDLLKQHLKADNLIAHSLAVEACMRAFARRFNEDEEIWGLAGLLHDLDYAYTVNSPRLHAKKTAEMLKVYDLDPRIPHAILGHNDQVERKTPMDHALYAIDPTTGFITAVALMHPSKSIDAAEPGRMKKRFKELKFAAGADRTQMAACSAFGVELDDFLLTCQQAMKGISQELGL